MSFTRWLYRTANRNWWQIPVVMIAIILLIVLFMSGCGTAREMTRTTVKQGVENGNPVATYERVVESEETSVVVPEIAAVMAAVPAASPFSWIPGAAGALVAALTGMKAIQLSRQRNELIDGVESSKGELPPEQWEKVTAKLAASQSADTQRAVFDRTP